MRLFQHYVAAVPVPLPLVLLFLAIVALVAPASSTLGAGATEPPADEPYAYDQVEVAPGVFAFVQRDLTPVASANIVAVIGDSAALVFDTGHHPPVTRRIAADIERLSGVPVRWIVISHWHDDHWVGAADLATVWPDARFVAHPFTARMMLTREQGFAGAPCSEEIDGQTQPMRDQLAAGTGADGGPLPEETLTRLRAWIAANEVYSAECAEMRFRAVDETVDSARTIDLGGRLVELEYPGRANTAGDLIAWIPDANAVLTGDLVVAPFPYATQSYITEWARALRAIEDRLPAIVVPGHGPVQRDRIYLDRVAATLESIAYQAREAYRPGMTADEVRSKIRLSSFREAFAEGQSIVRANFNYMMYGPAVDRMWQEITGQWVPEGG